MSLFKDENLIDVLLCKPENGNLANALNQTNAITLAESITRLVAAGKQVLAHDAPIKSSNDLNMIVASRSGCIVVPDYHQYSKCFNKLCRLLTNETLEEYSCDLYFAPGPATQYKITTDASMIRSVSGNLHLSAHTSDYRTDNTFIPPGKVKSVAAGANVRFEFTGMGTVLVFRTKTFEID